MLVIFNSSGEIGSHSSPTHLPHLPQRGCHKQHYDEQKHSTVSHGRSPLLNLEEGRILRTAEMALEPILRRANRSPVTGRLDGFAVSRVLRGSRPMGCVADLSNLYRRTLQGCYPLSIDPNPAPSARGFSSPLRPPAA